MKKKIKEIFCILFGHSRIVETCWGYVNCARCGQQLGDQLASYYDTKNNVIMNHNCKTCRKNYKTLTWKDKLFVKNPFGEEK